MTDRLDTIRKRLASGNPFTAHAGDLAWAVGEIERLTKERDARPVITAEDAEMYLVLVHDGWEGAAEKALVARVDGALREHAKGAF